MTRTALRFTSPLFTGLFAGFLLGILVLELSLRGFDGTVYAQVQQVALVALPVLATVLLFPAILCTVALVAIGLRRRDASFWLAAVALVLLLVALIVTLTVNVPINLAEGGWSVTSPPADWAAQRDRWQLGHAVRTVCAVLALCSLLAAGLRPRAARAIRP